MTRDTKDLKGQPARRQSWIARAIYQCPEKVSLELASAWLYQLQAVGEYFYDYQYYPHETIGKN